MKKYKQRMDEAWASLEDGSTHEKRFSNIRKLLALRKGEYLLKSTNKDLCLQGMGYIHYATRGDGWFVGGTRKEAAWFTKDEIKEIKYPGYKFVKR